MLARFPCDDQVMSEKSENLGASPLSWSWWPITLLAAFLLMVTMGTRQTMGLFISPINSSTGLGINAGASFGQFVFAPIAQKLISSVGWMNAQWSLAAMILLTLPITAKLRRRPQPVADQVKGEGLRAAVRDAFKDRSYLLLHAGFFTCGFHIAFLITLQGGVTPRFDGPNESDAR